MNIGVLAFHGDFAEHRDVLKSLGVHNIEVRSLEDLHLVTHLIIPGGESTVMAKFLEMTGLGKEITKRVRKETLAVYGTCAGAILIARKATGKHAPRTLGLIDITADRNAYGNQAHSFAADLRIKGSKAPVMVSFIRAPKVTKVGRKVQVLSTYKGEPVLVKQGRVLAGTFHPEVRGSQEIHKMFLKL